MLKTESLEYDLPDDLVAVAPAEPRDAARLLVLSRSDPSRLEHRTVRDLPELLDPCDLMVFNRSRVLPARFEGVREDTGGGVEGLYLQDDGAPDRWLAMVKSRRFKRGAPIRLTAPDGIPSPVLLTLNGRHDTGESQDASVEGAWRVTVTRDDGGPTDAHSVLEAFGLTPLPPYIRAARRRIGMKTGDEPDRAAYQTTYAGEAKDAHSVAAPTAGLHFTPELLKQITERGVDRAEVLLHVGAGTFKPVETERVEDHPMHRERCSEGVAGASINACRARDGRVISVGTTTARTLESFAKARAEGNTPGAWMETDLLITPGTHRWRAVDGLMTNFHQQRSTLMAMVAAFLDKDPGRGAERLLAAYRAAIRERYRFYSFGDAMLILP
ncbi:MAG: tRNA preQ1(34) S-adenosylmethionine ribosyltransferase-isomerase QueA [Planctomycetota bacterium]